MLLWRDAGLAKNGGMEGEDERRRLVASRWGEEESMSWEALLSEASLLIDFGVEDICDHCVSMNLFCLYVLCG